MEKFLTTKQVEHLTKLHKTVTEKTVADRIKVVIWANRGKSFADIAKDLMIDDETARNHLKKYNECGVLDNESGGSESVLTGDKAKEFMDLIDQSNVANAQQAIEILKKTTGIELSVSGMTAWLNRNGFSWKKNTGSPGKAKADDQALFIEAYTELKDTLPAGDIILFMDAAHPTQTTKLGYGWSRRGLRKVVSTTGAKNRINVLGSLNLEGLKLTVCFPKNVNSESLIEHFKQLRKVYPVAKHPTINLVLDQGPYNKSKDTKEAAEKYSIKLCFLPPYSPNLNVIERMWKLLNERVRNNVYFSTAASFEEAIKSFFGKNWRRIRSQYKDRFTDNFETLKVAY